MSPNLVFGAGSIGNPPNWDTPEKVSALLFSLQNLGISELDSAASYPPGNPWKTEMLLGETQAAKKGFIIHSKVLFQRQGKSLAHDNMATSIACTLRLLDVDKVTTMYAHAPDSSVPLQVQAANFHRQYLDGKFDRLGLSNYSADQMAEYFAICEENNYIKPSVYEGCYNALYRTPEKNLLPLLRKHNCVFYAFSPLAGGFLTGKVTLATNSTSLHGTRWKGHSAVTTYTKLFDKPAMHSAIRILEAACKASDPQLSLQEAALRWIVHHSALRDDDAIILGATRIEQLESNVADIRRGKLDASVLEAVEGLWALVENDDEFLV